jgi:hypothetical protein
MLWCTDPWTSSLSKYLSIALVMCKSQNILLRNIQDIWLNSSHVDPNISVRLFYFTKSEVFIPKMFLFFSLSSACRIFEIVYDPRIAVWDTCRPCCRTGFMKVAREPCSSCSILVWKWYGPVLGSSQIFQSIYHSPDRNWDRLVHNVRINKHIYRPLKHTNRH